MPNVNSGLGGWFGGLRKNKTLSSLSENMIDGFAYHKMVFDKDGKPVDYVFLEVNGAFERLTGLKRENILGKRVTEALPGIEKDPADWIGVYGKVALTCEPVRFENYNQALGKWFLVSAFCPEKGYFVATFEDITARRNAEEAVRISEERFRSVLNNSLDAIYRLNLQTERYEYMSPASKKLLNFEPDELMAMSNEEMLSRVHPDDIPAMRSALAHVNETGKGLCEYRFRGNDGNYRWWSNQMVVTKDAEGKPLYRDGFIRDVTERKNAEEALKKNEEEYSALFSNMIDGFAYCQMIFEESGEPVDFVYLQINDAFENITGLKRNDVIGKKVTEAIPGIKEANPELFKIYGRVAVTCKKEKFEIFFKPLSLWLSISVYCPRKGYFAALFEDITERKNSEAQIAWLASFPALNPNSVVEVDLEGNIQYANSATETTFAEFKKSGLKHPFFSDWHKVVTTLKTKKKSTFSREQEIETHWYYQDFTFFPQNNRVRIYTVNIDELKQAEDNLRAGLERERFLGDLVRNSSVAIGVGYPDGRMGMCNTAFQKLTGYSEEELKRVKWNTVLTPPEWIEIETKKLEELKTNPYVQYEKEYIRKDGSRVPIELVAHPFFDNAGNVSHYYAFITDITERKKAESALRESEQRWSTTLSSIGDAVIATDVSGMVTFMNAVAEELTGWTLDEASKKPIKAVFNIINEQTRTGS